MYCRRAKEPVSCQQKLPLGYRDSGVTACNYFNRGINLAKARIMEGERACELSVEAPIDIVQQQLQLTWYSRNFN